MCATYDTNEYDVNLKSGFYADDSLASGLAPWFLVSGDTEDFIFFGESGRTHSEK